MTVPPALKHNSVGPSSVIDVFDRCVSSMENGELIQLTSVKDKEFHFQNWFRTRLDALEIQYDQPGRNTYPDFSLVHFPEGYELKGLAWPGRERDYDCNSQVPSGKHNGRTIFYVFGRYPADLTPYPIAASGAREYPVIDLVLCHGDFLNIDHEYVHKNRSIKGFGSYGDLMIRDRKMYVAPTPFALTEGTTGLATLILPDNFPIDGRLRNVGTVNRTEAQQLVIGYSFDLITNDLTSTTTANPSAGHIHKFSAYRLKRQTNKPVVSATNAEEIVPKSVRVRQNPV